MPFPLSILAAFATFCDLISSLITTAIVLSLSMIWIYSIQKSLRRLLPKTLNGYVNSYLLITYLFSSFVLSTIQSDLVFIFPCYDYSFWHFSSSLFTVLNIHRDSLIQQIFIECLLCSKCLGSKFPTFLNLHSNKGSQATINIIHKLKNYVMS